MSAATEYRVIIRPSALNDLKDISSYIELHSPQNAPAVIAAILKAAESLAFMPNRTKRVGKSRSRGTPVHVLLEHPYLIYYAMEARTHSVIVFTVRHGARRQPRRFP
jgi:plasmid stabilization system protein ParE